MRPVAISLALLLLSAGALFSLDPDRLITQYHIDTWGAEEGLPRQPILRIAQDVQGYLRLSTADEDLRFDGLRFTAVGPGEGAALNLPAKGVPAKGVPAKGGPAASSAELPTSRPPELDDATSTLHDHDGNLWAAVPAIGLVRINEGGQSILGFSGGLPSDTITALFEDREANLWVATADASLSRLRNGEFILFGEDEGLPTSAVRSVFEAATGELWIGTDGGGLSHRTGDEISTLTTAEGLPSNVVLSLAEDRSGNLWIGTAGGGLSRLAGGALTTFGSSDGLPSDIVTALLEGRSGDLWVGTLGGGVARLRAASLVEVLDSSDGLNSNIIRALLEDRSGDLWIGTDDGLSRLSESGGERSLRNFSPADGLASPFVLSLHEDLEGRLWVGTDSGLSLFTGDAFVSLTNEQGLHNDVLYQILEDLQGNLWACSNRGVFSLRKSQLEQFLSGRVDRLTSEPLAGSRSHECNGFSQPAGWAGSGGELWFSTIDGLLEVHPEELMINPLPAPVALEAVRVDFEELSLTGSPKLPPDSRNFEFRFTALSLRDARRVRFSHRLLPFESSWTPPDERRIVRYTNLPPGDYRFQVTATNDTELWNPRPAEFTFTLRPPFYRTLPFYSIVLLGAFGLTAGLQRIHFRRLKERNDGLEATISRRTTEVLDQKEELGRANRRLAHANHQLRRVNDELANLDRENADFLAIAAHDLRAPLVNLKGFAGEIHSTLEELREVIEASVPHLSTEAEKQLRQALNDDAPEALFFIDSSTERMDQLIDALLALSQLGRQKLTLEPVDMRALVHEALRSLTYQISRNRVRVTVGDLPTVFADRGSMKQVMDNLLNNAVNYLQPGRPGRVRIDGEDRGAEVIVRVRDNGRGIDASQASKVFKIFGRAGNGDVPGEGVGLAFVRTIIERHGGRIWFDSEVAKGTVFNFTLPNRPSTSPETTDEG